MRLRAAVWAGIVLLAFGTAWKLERAACFSGDSLGKLVQSVSLRHNHFQSDELYYPGKAVDPGYRYYPFPGVYHLELMGRHVGPFPVAFSLVGALLSAVLPESALIFAGMGLFLLTVFVFDRFLRPHLIVLIAFAVGTPLLVMSLEFSENIYSAFIGACASVLWISALSDHSPRRYVAAGFLLAFSAFFRMEAALLTAAFSAAMLMSAWRRKTALEALRQYAPFGIAAAAGFAILLLFNWMLFGHVLGARMVANPMHLDLFSMPKLVQVQVLLLAGQGQLGFFGYMPGLLLLFFFLTRAKEEPVRVVFLSMILFIPAVAILSPHTGVVNWGPRFLLYAVFPCLYLFSRWFDTSEVRWQKILVTALFVPSLALTWVGYGVQKSACKQLRMFQQEFTSASGDVWIFSDRLLASSTGTEYLKRTMFLARTPEEMAALTQILKEKFPGKKAVYFSPVLPDEWKDIAPEEIRNRKDYGADLGRRFTPTGEKSSRFSRALFLDIP